MHYAPRGLSCSRGHTLQAFNCISGRHPSLWWARFASFLDEFFVYGWGMDKKSVGSPLVSWPVAVFGLMALANFYSGYAPLETARPKAPNDGIAITNSSSKVPLRLWQDPLQVLSNNLGDAGDTRGNWTSEVAGTLRSPDLAPAPLNARASRPSVQILLIPLTDLPSADARELRIRRRYAVIAAMRAHGLVPRRNAAHVGFALAEGSVGDCSTGGPSARSTRIAKRSSKQEVSR